MLTISGPRNSITSLCLLDLDSCDRCEVLSSIAAPSMAVELRGWARWCSRRAMSAVLQRGCAECRCRWISRVERRERDGRVRPSGFGNIAPWWRVPFRVVARRETESPGRNYDLRAPVRPQVKQEASTPWFLHSSRRFDASKQRVSSWAVVNRDGYWNDHAHAGEEKGSSIRHPQAPRRTTSPWLGGQCGPIVSPDLGAMVPQSHCFHGSESSIAIPISFVLAQALPLGSHRVQPRRRACGCWARELMMHTLDRGVPSQEHASWHSQLASQPRRHRRSAHICAGSVGPAARRRPELKAFVVHPFAFDLPLWPDGRDGGLLEENVSMRCWLLTPMTARASVHVSSGGRVGLGSSSGHDWQRAPLWRKQALVLMRVGWLAGCPCWTRRIVGAAALGPGRGLQKDAGVAAGFDARLAKPRFQSPGAAAAL